MDHDPSLSLPLELEQTTSKVQKSKYPLKQDMDLLVVQPPYKGQNNVWFTESLFWERVQLMPKKFLTIKPVFTLNRDVPGLINARKTFVQMEDPTGYKWAIMYLGDYDHWLYLCKRAWFKAAVDHWKEELSIKMKSEALGIIAAEMRQEGSKQALPAARYLATEEWNKPAHSRGRPSKDEVTVEMKKAMKILEQENDDATRIGLKVVK